MKSIKVLLILFILCRPGSVLSQSSVKVYGTVYDQVTNEPLAFVHISVVNSNFGTVSNERGEFLLFIPKQETIVIMASSMGFETQTKTITGGLLTIHLKPSTTLLKEVVVSATSEEPRKIVRRAFRSIGKNYFREPILMESFYRHYCRDDGVYGRVIEAKANIYKKGGYGRIEKYESNKDAFEVSELRRSYDQTKLKEFCHQPMGLDIALKSDVASLKQNPRSKNKLLNLVLGSENFINTKKNTFHYQLEEITAINNEEVYKIRFELAKVPKETNFTDISYQGVFYINKDNYAILRFENQIITARNEISQVVDYKNYNGKYALFHSRNDMTVINKNGQKHFTRIELITENIRRGKYRDIKQDKISRDYLATIPYNEEFWNNYSFIHLNPLSDDIADDLEVNENLMTQYKKVSEYEMSYSAETVAHEQLLNEVIIKNKGILVVDLWASWCAPCIKEYMVSKKNRMELSKKGVAFYMVSIDEDINRWRGTIESFDMLEENHLRIGPNSDFLLPLNIEGIPRFIIYQDQNLINDNAPFPSTQPFLDFLEPLLLNEEKSAN